jgi:hypothetical protein
MFKNIDASSRKITDTARPSHIPVVSPIWRNKSVYCLNVWNSVPKSKGKTYSVIVKLAVCLSTVNMAPRKCDQTQLCTYSNDC